jgi:hypothetical protein
MHVFRRAIQGSDWERVEIAVLPAMDELCLAERCQANLVVRFEYFPERHSGDLGHNYDRNKTSGGGNILLLIYDRGRFCMANVARIQNLETSCSRTILISS